MSTMFDKVLAYQFIKKLTTPFTSWPAYSMHLIDAKGNFLKDKSKFTSQEANAMGYFDILILNIKKLLAKIPAGGSRLGTIAATIYLLRTPVVKESVISEEDMENDLIEIMESLKLVYEDGAVAVNSAGSGSIAGVGQPPGSYKGLPAVGKGPMARYKKANRDSEGPILSNIQRRLKVSEGSEVGIKTEYDDGGPDYAKKNTQMSKKVYKSYVTFIKKAKKPIDEDLNDVVGKFPGNTTSSTKGFSQDVLVQNPVVKQKKNLKTFEASTLEYHDTLNPKIWDDRKLKPEIRGKLLQIAEAWREFAKIRPDTVVNIILTGGNANYNYTSQSDLDLHLIIDRGNFNNTSIDRAFVDEYLQDKKILWTLTHGDINIYGYPVELYAQDLQDEPHYGQGVYSVSGDYWMREPEYLSLDFESDPNLQDKVDFYKDMIDKMIDQQADSDAIDTLKNRIKTMRGDSIAQGGEFAFGNLVFKELRNSGYLDKLSDYDKSRKDKALSLE